MMATKVLRIKMFAIGNILNQMIHQNCLHQTFDQYVFSSHIFCSMLIKWVICIQKVRNEN